MTKQLRTEEEANQELADALQWYEERRPGLGSRFLRAVDLALIRIQELPRIGSAAPDVTPELGVRWLPIAGFPYKVVYLETPDAIRVLAFAHDRRRPGFWRARLG